MSPASEESELERPADAPLAEALAVDMPEFLVT